MWFTLSFVGFLGLSAGLVCRIYLGRRHGRNVKSCHCRSARIKGNLDDASGGYLSDDAIYLLVWECALGSCATPLPPSERFFSWISAVLLWRVLTLLQVPGAWMGAALWALHPVQVESVAWIAELKNTQSGLFFLLSILCFLKWVRTTDEKVPNRHSWNYAVALLFAALAMASKSSTVILPLILWLCVWWQKGRCNWTYFIRLLPMLLMSIGAGAVSLWTQALTMAGAAGPLVVWTGPGRLIAAGYAVWFYLEKLIWPHPLVMIYNPHWNTRSDDWTSYLPLLAVIASFFILWLKRESSLRAFYFSFACFLAALFPVLGFFDDHVFRYSRVFDHFQYLASMAPMALVGAGIEHLRIKIRSAQSILFVGMLLVEGGISWQRAWVYRNQEALWTDTINKSPKCWVAYTNLGLVFLQKGWINEATVQFLKALEINPNDAVALNDFGNALFREGKVDAAVDEYKKAVELDPNSSIYHANLGAGYLKRGELLGAVQEYEKASKIDPIDPGLHASLANIFTQEGQSHEAILQYKAALAYDADNAKLHNNLGISFLQIGDVNDAVTQFEAAIQVDAGLADSHCNLGVMFAQQGRLDDAIAQFKEALRLNPEFGQAKENLIKSQALKQQYKTP